MGDEADNTALIWAVDRGNTEVVKHLLQSRRLDVNVKGVEGWTALIIASRSGFNAIAELLLLDERTDVNIQDDKGNTAFHSAIEYDMEDIVKVLLKHNDINLRIVDENGFTPAALARKWKGFNQRANRIATLMRRVEKKNSNN